MTASDTGSPFAASSPGALQGRVVALPETRELEALTHLLQEQGARTLRCPLLGILDTPDQPAVEAWLNEFIAGGLDDLILFTGEGIKRLSAAAERMGKTPEFTTVLGKVRKITRGPKPARALTAMGLHPDIAAPLPTTDGIIAVLKPLDIKDRKIGIQLYGQEPNEKLIRFLTDAGATPRPVAPYVYAPASEDEKVVDLITRLAMGQVDVIAFTSAGQVKRLHEVAETYGHSAALRAGLERTTIAAVGPVVAEELSAHGIAVDARPERNYFMKPLVNQIVAVLTHPPEPQ